MSNKPTTRLASLDLSAFSDQPAMSRPTAEEIDRTATLPRRDPQPEREGDSQANIRGRMSVIDRFKDISRINA